MSFSFGLAPWPSLQLLMACSDQNIDDMTLTMDIRDEPPTDDDNRLVDGFAIFYQNRAQMFELPAISLT